MVNIDKGKFFSRNSNSKGRSKALVHSMRICWKYGRHGHYKRVCKSKAMQVSKGYDENNLIERNTTLDKGGDVYLALTSTQSIQEVWLINS
jgi:hypothetical protein